MLKVLRHELLHSRTVIHQAESAVRSDDLNLDAMTASFEQTMRAAPSNNFVPSWLRMADKLGCRHVLAVPFLRDLLSGLRFIKEGRPHFDKNGVRAVAERFAAAALNIGGEIYRIEVLQRNLGRADLADHVLEPKTCEIGVLFPRPQIVDLEELAKQVGRVDRALRTFQELSGVSGSLRLRGVATGSVEVFALTDLATGAAVATVLVAVVKAWKTYQEARKLAAEATKIERENAEATSTRAREEVAARRSALVEILVKGSAVYDLQRRNELVIATEHAVKYIEQQAQVGVVFEVRVVSRLDPSPSEASSDDDATQIIRERGGVMAQMDEHLAPLQLPKAGA